jgi:hypothetical protein
VIAEHLPEAVGAASIGFITGSLIENPSRVGRELRNGFAGIHSACRGSYRILSRIDARANGDGAPCRPRRRHLSNTLRSGRTKSNGFRTRPVPVLGGQFDRLRLTVALPEPEVVSSCYSVSESAATADSRSRRASQVTSDAAPVVDGSRSGRAADSRSPCGARSPLIKRS